MDRVCIPEQQETASPRTEKQRYYKTVDLVRLICSFFVVLIHMGFGNKAAIIPCVTRQAVPFFFLVSGFFYEKRFKAIGCDFRFARSYAVSIAIVYALWILLWLPYTIRDILTANAGRSTAYIALVAFRRILLAGTAPYWYLLALSEGSIVLALILCSARFRLGWLLCIGGLLLNFLYCNNPAAGIGAIIHKLFYVAFSWEYNVVMIGFPMLFLGAALSRFEEAVRTWKRVPIILLYFTVTLAAFVIHPYSNNLFGFPVGVVQALLLFIFCILPSGALEMLPDGICRVSRDLSSVVFFTHTAFLTILGEALHIWDTAARLPITILGGALLLLLIKKLRWKPLYRLFMLKN